MGRRLISPTGAAAPEAVLAVFIVNPPYMYLYLTALYSIVCLLKVSALPSDEQLINADNCPHVVY
ncbi:hypothetical protein D3C71_1913560 [compost metagenome]